ncbi:unnamed protein product, partial [Rotaria magnacalcarata]
LFLEQQQHSTATNEHKRLVKEIKSGIIELFSRFKTLETNLLASSYDDLDEELTAWLQNTKMIAPIVERFQELYDHVYELDKN